MPNVLIFLNEITQKDVADCLNNPNALQADGVIFQTSNTVGRETISDGNWARVIRNIGPQHVLALAEANDNNMYIMAAQNRDFLLAKEACKRVKATLVATLVYYEGFRTASGDMFPNTTLTWGELEDLKYKYNNAFDNKIVVFTRQYTEVDSGSMQTTRRKTLIDDALMHPSCKGAAIEFSNKTDVHEQEKDFDSMNLSGFVKACLDSGKAAYVLVPPSAGTSRYNGEIRDVLRSDEELPYEKNFRERFTLLGIAESKNCVNCL